MVNPPPRVDFPAEAYPITFEAFRVDTGERVFSKTVERPPGGLDDLVVVYIPPLKKIFGAAVDVRVTYATGEVFEA